MSLPVSEDPGIFVMHEGRYYRYHLSTTKGDDDTYDNVSGMIHFINRIQHPLALLNSEEAIKGFLDESQEIKETTGFLRKENPQLGIHYDKLKYKTRVLVFMLDKDEYATEM